MELRLYKVKYVNGSLRHEKLIKLFGIGLHWYTKLKKEGGDLMGVFA